MATQIAGNGTRRTILDIVVGVSIIVTAAAIVAGVRTIQNLVTQVELANNNYQHSEAHHERTHDRYEREHEQINRRLTEVERDRQQSGEHRSP